MRVIWLLGNPNLCGHTTKASTKLNNFHNTQRILGIKNYNFEEKTAISGGLFTIYSFLTHFAPIIGGIKIATLLHSMKKLNRFE